MNLPEKIESERVWLVHPMVPTFALAQELYQIVDGSRETLREWLPWVDKTHSAEDEFAGFLMHISQNWKEEKGFAYLVYPKDTEKIAGVVDMIHVNETVKSSEIGYWLGNEAVGHGYMQEAVRTLESAAFQAGINRIIIRNDTKNVRSVRVAERCGYTLEGVMRQDAWDDFRHCLRDTNIWAKLKADWDKQREV